MIRQSGINPPPMVIDPQPITTPSTEPEGQWQGLRRLRSASYALVQSLNPCYKPPNNQHASAPVATDFPALDNQTSHCPGFTTLAARAIAAWANLPPEINQALGYLANLVAAGQAASDQFDALTAPAGVVNGPGTDWENAPDETVKNAKKKTIKAPQYPRQQPDKTTTTLSASQLPNTSLALGALVGLSAVGASSASDCNTASGMPVRTAGALNGICKNNPCHGTWRLTANIDGRQLQPIGEKNNPFTGKLCGDNYTVNNLRHCLVKHLAGEGLIDGLRFKDANILQVTGSAVGVAACEISGNATVSNILVENARLEALAAFDPTMNAGIAVGKVEEGAVINTTAVNCTVKTLLDNACAGIGAGNLVGGYVINTQATNCTVETQGANSPAGIGAGRSFQSKVNNTAAQECHVKTFGKQSHAGIGAGNNTGNIANTIAIRSTVKTSGYSSHAAISTGINHETGAINGTIAVNCDVSTRGEYAKAGLGAGYIEKKGSITNTRAIDSNVTSRYATADISGGKNPILCNVRVNRLKKSSDGGCQSWRDNNFCANIDPSLLTPKCRFVDTSLDNPANTRPTSPIPKTVVTEPDTTFARPDPGAMPLTTFMPATATVPDTIYSNPDPIATSMLPKTFMPATTFTPTTATVPDTPLSSPDPVATSMPPTTFMPATATVPDTTLSSSSPGSTALATQIPPVASLNATTKAVIALGTVIVVLLGVIGVISCRYYRLSTNVNRNREQPMPEGNQPRTEGQRCTRDHYSPSENRRPRPALPREHYQPLLFNLIALHPVPQSRYQGLVYEQANMATGGSIPLAGNELAADFHHSDSDSPVYQELSEPETDSDHSHDHPFVLALSGMATGASSPTTNPDQEPDYDQLSNDNVQEMREPR